MTPRRADVEPHTPDWFSCVKLPVTYDQAAVCDQRMKTLFVNIEGDMERIAILQEFTGYLLWPQLTFEKYLTLLGDGGNGKSAFIALTRRSVRSPRKRGSLDGLRNYLSVHADHLNYSHRLADGLSIGSGQIEEPART